MDHQEISRSIYFEKFKPLDVTLLIETSKKLKSLDSKNFNKVKIYVRRSTNHGQKLVQNLIGNTQKDMLRFILSDTFNVDEIESTVDAFNKKVAAFNDKLDFSSCRRPVDFDELTNLKDEISIHFKKIYKTVCTALSIGRTPSTYDKFKLCMDCKSRITKDVSERDMSAEELEKEKEEVKKLQGAIRPGDCSSSFCFGSCSRCEHTFRTIIPGTKMFRRTETCLCGTIYVSPERPDRKD